MIGHLKERLQKDFPNVRPVVLSNRCTLEMIDGESVDVVYCTIVFMHLDEWDRYSYPIRDAFRVLRPGGPDPA